MTLFVYFSISGAGSSADRVRYLHVQLSTESAQCQAGQQLAALRKYARLTAGQFSLLSLEYDRCGISGASIILHIFY